MKMNWLMTTAAAAILASTGLAAAQGMNEHGGKSPGAMDKSAPSAQSEMKGKESGKAKRAQSRNGAKKKSETTGQSPQADNPSGAAQQKRDKSDTAGQAPDSKRKQRTGADQKQQKQQRGAAQKKGTDAKQKQGANAKTKSETTGRGDAKGASLTSEQRTKIRKVVVSKKIPKLTKVNFTVSVGARIPRTVRFHPIPAEIVTIYPAWRGYRVILVGSELIIVHPTSYEIIAVIVV